MADLPDNYKRAADMMRRAAEQDECADWDDRMAALASYAKQVDDDDWDRLVLKIKRRAIRNYNKLAAEMGLPAWSGHQYRERTLAKARLAQMFGRDETEDRS